MTAPSMRFATTNGNFDFEEERLPLPMRRIEYQRKGGEEGSAMRKVNCTLSGYFTGENGGDARARYDLLIATLNQSYVDFSWHDGSRQILSSQQVYLQDISEPSQWGQYLVDYTIPFYYFTCAEQGGQIPCSFSGTEGSFSFEMTPGWAFGEKNTRSSPLTPERTPGGASRGSIINIQLSGQICADNYHALEQRRRGMMQAFSGDGVLNYGDFSNSVHIVGKSIPTTTPKTHFDYSIELAYYSSYLVNFKATRSISRINFNPIIHEMLNCNVAPIVKTRPSKGQTIDYHVSAEGYTLSAIRSALANELAMLRFQGGVELPGGREVWNDDPPAVSCDFQVYYSTPVVANL